MTRAGEAHVAMRTDMARTLGIDPTAHPRPEVLWEYQEGLLGEMEEEGVRDHLTVCPACARQVLELSGAVEPELPDDGEAPLPLSDEKMAKLWPKLRTELAAGGPEVETPKVLSWRRKAERIALPLAAVLALAVVGLGVREQVLLEASRRAGEPVPNVEMLDLAPKKDMSALRGGEEGPTLRGEAGGIFVRLNIADRGSFPRYRAELLRIPNGTPEWRTDDLRPSPAGAFSLELPRSYVGRKPYTLRLYGLAADGSPTLLAEYEVDLRAQS